MDKEKPKKINGVDEATKLYGFLEGNGIPVKPPTIQERLKRLYPEKGSAIPDGTFQRIVEQAVTNAYKPRKKNGKKC